MIVVLVVVDSEEREQADPVWIGRILHGEGSTRDFDAHYIIRLPRATTLMITLLNLLEQ